MDAVGARALQHRIAQQAHWRQAAAVCEGRQPRMDPDQEALLELRGGERVYRDRWGPFVKRLIDGAWARIEMA